MSQTRLKEALKAEIRSILNENQEPNNLTKLESLEKKIKQTKSLQEKKKYAIECAELVLPIWEKYYPNDNKPKKAIEAAKKAPTSNPYYTDDGVDLENSETFNINDDEDDNDVYVDVKAGKAADDIFSTNVNIRKDNKAAYHASLAAAYAAMSTSDTAPNAVINFTETAAKEAIKATKEHVNPTKIQELARVATTIKISNDKAAKAYVDANKGKWVSDMVQAVIDAGDKGITQPDLAAKIGKGSQQTINPKVRELLAAGVFTQGEASIKSEPKNNNPVIKALPPKDDEDIEDIEVVDDEEDLDVDSDDYEKPDEDDSEDEDELAKKAAPSKGVDSPSKQLDSVIKKMKDLAKKYKEAEGEEKADITAQLKDLTKEKTKLEKEINKSLGADEDEDEV